jgi:hypothetical protein
LGKLLIGDEVVAGLDPIGSYECKTASLLFWRNTIRRANDWRGIRDFLTA